MHRTGAVERVDYVIHAKLFGGVRLVSTDLYESCRLSRELTQLCEATQDPEFPFMFHIGRPLFPIAFLKPDQEVSFLEEFSCNERRILTGSYDTMLVPDELPDGMPILRIFRRDEYRSALEDLYGHGEMDDYIALRDDRFLKIDYDEWSYNEWSYNEIDYAHLLWEKARRHVHLIGRLAPVLRSWYDDIFDPDKELAIKRAKTSFDRAARREKEGSVPVFVNEP